MKKIIIPLILVLVLCSFASAFVNYTIIYENTNILENQQNKYFLNITFNSPYVYGNITYNNTEYTTTKTSNATHSILSNLITTPPMNNDTNITFFWSYSNNLDDNFWKNILNLSSYWTMNSNHVDTNGSTSVEDINGTNDGTLNGYTFNHGTFSNIVCEDPTANDTSCSLTNGTYDVSVYANWINVSKLFDNDYTTWGESNSGVLYFYMNYSKPAFVRGAVWQVSDDDNTTNITLPYACYSAFSDKVALRATSDHTTDKAAWHCYNNTNEWVLLKDIVAGHGDDINEETIFWDVTPINTSCRSDYGNCLQLDGVEDYITLNAITDISPKSSFSVGGWIKTLSSTTTQNILYFQSSASSRFVIDYGGGALHGALYNGSSYENSEASGAMNINEWVHFVYTYDNGEGDLYINGVNQIGTYTPISVGNTNIYAIGARAGSSLFFNGSIDSVLIYNRSLSSTEILEIYDSETKYTPIGQNLISQYAFENRNTTHTFDENNLVAGKWGEANYFDGVGNYVNIGNETTLNSSFSIGMWIKAEPSNSITLPIDRGGLENGWQIRGTGTNGIYAFKIDDGSNDAYVYTDSDIEDEEWHHIFVTLDGRTTNSMKMYVDGINENNASPTSVETLAYNKDIIIGARSNTISLYFNGSIDDVMIFNRSLTSEEISQLYNHTYKANTTTSEHQVFHFDMDNCSIYSTQALNYTMKDESNGSVLNADLSTTFKFWLSDNNSYVKTYSFTQTNSSNYPFCIYPSFVNLTSNFTLSYSKDEYQDRQKIEEGTVLSSSISKIDLTLLKLDDGIFARFKTVDSKENTITGVLGKMTVSGETVIIDSQTSDDSGLLTFFVDPDTHYTFTFSKTGYTTLTKTLRVTTGDIFTVVMEGGEEIVNKSIYSGLRYEFYPNVISLKNNTDYQFTFNLSSSVFDLENCVLNLKLGNGTLLSTTSGIVNTTNCNLAIDINTDNYSVFNSEAIVTTNRSSVTYNRIYGINNIYQGDFSLMTIINDIKNFTDAGFNDKTKTLIAIFMILFVAIVMTGASKAGGIDSPEPTVLLIILTTLFFSWLGWLTSENPLIPVVGGIDLKQYIFFMIVLLAGVGYIIQRHR